MVDRRNRRIARTAACAAAVCIAAISPSQAAATQPNSADRVIVWTKCTELPTLTDAELDTWKSSGVDGFACIAGWLRGMGGTQDFTGDPDATLAGSNYELQRGLRDSRVIARMRARGMKAYLGVYLVNYFNTATPLHDWFDEAGWSGLVLPKLGDLAAAAKRLGFAGLSFDQELYGQEGGVQTASWGWNYQGNTRPEQVVRAKAKQRGEELMTRLLSEFPGIELLAYDVQLPETWGELVQLNTNGYQNVYGPRLDIDFWDGLSSVEGYGALRLADADFYKIPHYGTWETAFQYHFNNLYAYLSRRLSNWDYASSRFHVSPFAWIDRGPCGCSFEEPRAPAYVANQLAAFSKWGMGGEFANFAYGGLRGFDYAPYVSAMQAGSTPAVSDSEPPTLTISNAPPDSAQTKASLALNGTVTDNLAIRAVRWRNHRGGTGVARLNWDVTSGGYPTGYVWRTRWSIPALALKSGRNEIAVTAEDIKGVETTRTFTVLNGTEPRSPSGVPKVLTLELRNARKPRLAVFPRTVRLVRGRRVRIRVRCRGSEPCLGVLSLHTTARHGVSGRRQPVKLARARFAIGPGRTALVHLRLSRFGVRLLRRSGRLGVLVRASASLCRGRADSCRMTGHLWSVSASRAGPARVGYGNADEHGPRLSRRGRGEGGDDVVRRRRWIGRQYYDGA